MIKVNNKNTRTMSMMLFWVFLLSTYFTSFPCVSIVEFEQVNASWVFGSFF